ncbi:hypothetical protein WJX72_003609 [[Myrmecia] bisecta]|uniref:J domain-containing protein n=1 Tax=[Myrmecia] bisecta TaxID=41462 RepID=A0AAW1PJL6_9CHLO
MHYNCTVPVPLHDAGEAGSVWRIEKLRDFDWKVRCAGLETSGKLQELLQQIQQNTVALEELQKKQQASDYQPAWWADGEYSDSGADRANDEGMRAYSAGLYSAAFDHFTEAIRLCPQKAVYHGNRAAAAGKLGQHKTAAEDCRNAISRDETYVKGYLRGAAAHLGLNEPQEAERLYAQALKLQPQNRAAQVGLQRAAQQAASLSASTACEQAGASSGQRAAMPQAPLSEKDAAQLLYTADQLLHANPTLSAAKYSKMEALIHCRRYMDALEMAPALLEGADKLCLMAEAQWRQGCLDKALTQLQEALTGAPNNAKCQKLQAVVLQLHGLTSQAAAFYDEGCYQDCTETCTEALASLHAAACSGLFARLLHQRAQAHLHRQHVEAARTDLDAALQLEPYNPECLLLRSQVQQQAGRAEAAFLDLQRLASAAPGFPGMLELLEQAATLCLGRRKGARTGKEHRSSKAGDESYYDILHVVPDCEGHEIRRAYRLLASQWHPDKWATASAEAQELATKTFGMIQQAYETLSDANKRLQYDATLYC